MDIAKGVVGFLSQTVLADDVMFPLFPLADPAMQSISESPTVHIAL